MKNVGRTPLLRHLNSLGFRSAGMRSHAEFYAVQAGGQFARVHSGVREKFGASHLERKVDGQFLKKHAPTTAQALIEKSQPTLRTMTVGEQSLALLGVGSKHFWEQPKSEFDIRLVLGHSAGRGSDPERLVPYVFAQRTTRNYPASGENLRNYVAVELPHAEVIALMNALHENIEGQRLQLNSDGTAVLSGEQTKKRSFWDVLLRRVR